MRRNRGQALVEFALIFPILFFILALSIDVFRVDWVSSTVAEAARQGARQAIANEDASDNGFGPSAGPCSGTTQTPSATGSGCLKTARIYETVLTVLGGFAHNSMLTEAPPAACPNPVVGATSVCVYPGEQGVGATYPSCNVARIGLGRDPIAGDLGSRSAEYASPQYKGCFEVVVTVIYRYDTLVPFLGGAAPNFLRISSSTQMLAEY
jgi:TadE-like protein